MSRVAFTTGERLSQLRAEAEFSLYYFGESIKTFFDLVGAKIALDDKLNQGKGGIHHKNGCRDFFEDAMDTAFYRLRHRLKDDFRRYQKAGERAADHSREERKESA